MNWKVIHNDDSEVDQSGYSGDVNEEANVKVFKIIGSGKEYSIDLSTGKFNANGVEYDSQIAGERSLVYRRRTSVVPVGKIIQHIFGFKVAGEVKKVMLLNDKTQELEYKDSL